MSHGNIEGKILAQDGKFYNFYSDVVDKICSIELLNGKPKLFIGQFCRNDGIGLKSEAAQRKQHPDCGIITSAFWGTVDVWRFESFLSSY